MKLLIKILLTTILNSICLLTFGQSKLVLCKGIERETIREDKLIGITLIGEEFKYQNWKSIFKCNDDINQNLWVVDKIGYDSLFLVGYNYKLSFIYDTILRKNIKTLKHNNYVIDSIIPSKKGKHKFDKLICKITTEKVELRYKKVSYDSIKSLTFAHLDISKYINPYNGYSHFHLITKGYFHYHRKIPSIHCKGGKGALCILIIDLSILSIDLSVNLTIDLIDHIEAEVHTYNLKDWKLKIN